LVAGGVITWNIANGCYTHHAHVIHHGGLIENAGFQFLDMIIWVKSGANYGITRHTHIKRTRHYYPVPKWEALLIYQKCGKMPQMTPDAARYMWEHHTDVWDIPPVINQMKNYGHPAVCPVEIPYRSIMSYTEKDALVFEPFGGSGTTLIAAEMAGRTAYLIEKNPLYCDRIVARWEQTTGERAKFAGA
jgi:DNA modification methylase